MKDRHTLGISVYFKISLTGFVIDMNTEVAITRLHMTSYLYRVHVERLTQIHQLHGYRVIVKRGVREIVIQYRLIRCNVRKDVNVVETGDVDDHVSCCM